MTDVRPPRLVGGERATLTTLLQFQRESLVRKVSGVSEAGARWTSVGSGTTLLWLVKHMAGAESLWVVRRFAGLDRELPDETVYPQDTVESALGAYQAVWPPVDAIIAAAPDLGEVCRSLGADPPVNLRWVLGHLLEETARHAGHADILRELVDGTTGR